MLSKLYGSFPEIGNVAGATAVFSIFVSIAFKLLSAELAYQTIVCFALYQMLVAVPPGHAAAARTEFLGACARWLEHRPATVQAGSGVWNIRVAPDVGIDGVHR